MKAAWTKPTNIGEGEPMIFGICPQLRLKASEGPARVQYYLMTGEWMVVAEPPANVGCYACATIRDAIQMAKTVNHYVATGKQKAFRGGSASELEVVEAKGA